MRIIQIYLLILRMKKDNSLILNSIKNHYSFKTDVDFANFLGIAPQTLSSWHKRNTIDYELISAKCVGINANWLISGKGEMLQATIIDATDNNLHKIPLVNVTAVGGFGNAEFAIQESDVKDYYVIPKFKDRKIDFMIEVAGSSMYPKYASGDVVACTVIRESRFIQWGKVYVVGTHEQGILVKRLYQNEKKDKNCIVCKSDNPKYPPFEVRHNEITGIALVVGVVRFE